MLNYTHVMWDWNGTLFDDMACCLESITIMLAERGLPVIDAETYRKVFGFPIEAYYRRLGFDFDHEPYDSLAGEYIRLYSDRASQAPLFAGAREILGQAHDAGIHQVIVSASELGNLLAQVRPFGIEPWFDEILGLNNILAASKADLGRDYIRRIHPGRALFIGDTLHDKEVADAMGVECVLVAAGHQNRAVLQSSGATIVGQLADLRDILA